MRTGENAMQRNSGNVLLNRASKAVVDILLLAGLVLSQITSRSADYSWLSPHSIVSMAWFALMVIHIYQHWGMTVAVMKLNRNVLKRNKITLVTTLMFIMLTISIILFIVDVDDKTVQFHHAVVSPMRIVIIAHMVAKLKQFVRLFPKAKSIKSDKQYAIAVNS